MLSLRNSKFCVKEESFVLRTHFCVKDLRTEVLS